MGLYEEADLAAKKALKHYPNEVPLRSLRAAIVRDWDTARAVWPEQVT